MTKATDEVDSLRSEMIKKDNEIDKSGSASKELSEMSDEELKKLGYKRHRDGSIRDSLGHFAGYSGIKPGSYAVDIVEEYLKNNKYSINGREICVESSEKGRRFYDIIVTDENGVVFGIEVKSGSATRNKHQKEFDAELVKSGGLNAVGKKALQAGVKKVSKLMVIHVDYDGNINMES